MERVQTENDKKKEYLWSYQRAKHQLERLEDELGELRLNKQYPSAGCGDGMPHGAGGGDLSGYAARVDELETKILQAKYRRINKLAEVRERIDCLENEQEKDVLFFRYIKGMQWEDVCSKMGYSWKQVHRFHSKALKNLKMT